MERFYLDVRRPTVIGGKEAPAVSGRDRQRSGRVEREGQTLK